MNCRMAWSAVKPLLAAILFLGASHGAQAAAACSFSGSGSTAFGPYDILSVTATDTVATIRVRCENVAPGNPNISLTVGLGAGNGSSVQNRRMAHAGGTGDLLNYGLFRDASRSAVWGYTPALDALTQTVKVQNNRTAEAIFTIYGRIPPQQDVTPGDYSDTVQVTLSP
jgi:spore coat protein U-like protein